MSLPGWLQGGRGRSGGASTRQRGPGEPERSLPSPLPWFSWATPCQALPTLLVLLPVPLLAAGRALQPPRFTPLFSPRLPRCPVSEGQGWEERRREAEGGARPGCGRCPWPGFGHGPSRGPGCDPQCLSRRHCASWTPDPVCSGGRGCPGLSHQQGVWTRPGLFA